MATGWKKDYFRYKDFFLNVLSFYNAKPNLRIYLELILSLSTIIVFALFAVKPTVLTIIELTKEIQTKEETSAKLKQKIRNLQTVSNLLQTQSEDIKYVDQAVPQTALPETLVKQIETISKENSLQILGFSASDVTLSGKEIESKKTKKVDSLPNNANEFPFTFSASGTFPNIFSFLTKLEDLRRPVKFDSFILNSNVTEGGKVIVLTITGRVPYLLK